MSSPGARAALLSVLALVAAGPLFAPALPAGPAALLLPRPAAVGAGGAAILFLLFAWPAVARDRSGAALLRAGAETVLLAAPFVAGPARAGGADWAAIAAAMGIVAGAALVTGLWLAGPGRRPERDRFFAAGAVAVVAALPFANYVFNEFAVAAGEAGYRLSPLLALRAVLLGLPGADATPALLLLLAAAATLSGVRAAGRAAALAVLLAAGSATAGEVEPVLGEFYVPGRPLPLRVRAGGPEIEAWVAGVAGRYAGVASGGTFDVTIPGPERLTHLTVESGGAVGILRVDLAPVPPGSLLVSLGPCPSDLLKAAAERGFRVGRALPSAEGSPPGTFLSADGVLDPARRLPPETAALLASAGVAVVRAVPDLPARAEPAGAGRRPWEEPGKVLDRAGLERLFPPAAGPDPARGRFSCLLLLAYAVAAGAALRWGRGRPRSGPAVLAVLSAAAIAGLAAGLPLPAAVRESSFEVREGGRSVSIRLLRAGDRPGPCSARFEGFPLLLGDASPEARVLPARGGGWVVAGWLPAHSWRIVASTTFGPEPPEGQPDLLIGPAGLAVPGEAFRPAAEILGDLPAGEAVRETAIRRLLRAADPPAGIREVRFAAGGMTIGPPR